MLRWKKTKRWVVCTASVVGMGLIVSSGCQTWHASSAIPGLKSKQGERQVLREAKNDPFPSPSEVGMKVTK